jgi:ribosomal protein S18 acetylase RimI-like enzyme
MTDENATVQFNPEVTIVRIATSDDVPVLRELYEKSKLEGQLRMNDTGADLDHLMDAYFECNDSGFWVAENDSSIVGMVGVQRLSDNSAEIRRLRVRDGYRRRGIGGMLMEHAITFCHDKQFLKIVLDVRIERSPAISMFDKFGFSAGRERVLNGRKLLDFYLDLYSDTTDTRID